MRQGVVLSLSVFLSLLATATQSQNLAGYWLGVTYPSDPKQAVYNYTMTLTQNGNTLGGTAQTANPNLPFGGLAYLSGQLTSTQITFSEMDKNGSTTVQDVCFWRGTLTYNAADESLTGAYENITNGVTCKDVGSGKVELYRIILKSGNKFCKGGPINLLVTGKNIRWYASASRTNMLAVGNTYSPKISQTTTFYITQTLYQTESPVVPITVEIVEPTFTVRPLNTGCSQTDSAIEIVAPASTDWQYSLNGGTFQTKPLFTSLKPGSYTVVAKDAAGCQAEQVVTLTPENGPSITQLATTSPQCETANGSVNVIAAGGKAPLTYSMDYGQTFQTSSRFSQLSGGTYTFRVRDANGCEFNRVATLPSYNPMAVLSVTGSPTTCGQPNGQVIITTAGGIFPVTYSLDKQSFQPKGTFTNLKAGDYTITARDSANCTVSQPVGVATSKGPQTDNFSVTPESCGQQNGAIFITENSSANVVEYSLDGQTYQRTTNFSGLKTGAYRLTAKDSSGCMAMVDVTVPTDCANLIHLPTAFSPNADQQNDAFVVHFAQPSLTVLRLTIFDRWGAVVYNRSGFELLSGESVWDGQVNGRTAPAGVYVYRLDCQFPDGTQTTYRESITLLIK
ncbi:gliding motility-associated C-terminal domain-containing protein [Spirosoma sp.]|uniref:T9SS type B sorting domain-containing protein n=1 Tax=Spirosoma sp. TaxID=1899569 RepID=UPI003B3BC308